jgi:hypothetical protein
MLVLVFAGIALAVVGLLLQLFDVRLVKPESGSAGKRITSRLFAAGVVCQVVGVILIVVGGVNT